MWHRAAYRASQFFRGFRTTFEPAELRAVAAFLTPEERALFASMEARDQRHSLNMLHWLEAHAPDDARPSFDLLAAVLLHDVGKGPLVVWDRVAFVLLGAAPMLRRRLGSERGRRWQRAQWHLEHHARLGATRLTAVGTRARVIELVARHKDARAGGDEELAWLMAADAVC